VGVHGSGVDVGSDAALSEAGPLDRRVIAVGGVVFAVLTALSTRYGFQRDEVYMLDCARHLQASYVDQPVLAPLLARVSLDLFGVSLPWLRLWPALAGQRRDLHRGLQRGSRHQRTRPGHGTADRRERAQQRMMVGTRQPKRHHRGGRRTRPDRRPRVRKIAPDCVAAVFDHVGGPGIVKSWRMLGRGGTLVSYGTAATKDVPGNPRLPVLKLLARLAL
jgi:hypothetical protein